MGLWSSFVHFWYYGFGPAEQDDERADFGGGTAVLEAPRDWTQDDDVGAPREREPLRWWQPAGPCVTAPPRLERPISDARAAAHEQAILKSLEATLRDPNIELPRLPHIPEKVLNMLRSNSVSMTDIAAIVSQDQVLSADLLRRANSSAYGGSQKVTALNAALARLGVRGIRSFMIGHSVRHLTLAVGGKKSMGENLWRESLASAFVAGIYADCFNVDTDEAFLLGLLHDIGKVVVLRACAEAERIYSTTVPEQTFAFLCQEYHEMMGEMLSQRWGLPGRIGAVMAKHHGPLDEQDPHASARALIQLTDATISLLGHSAFVPYDLRNLPAVIFLRAAHNAAFHHTLDGLPEAIELAMSDF